MLIVMPGYVTPGASIFLLFPSRAIGGSLGGSLHVRGRCTNVGQGGATIPLYRDIANRDDADHVTTLIDDRKAADGFLTHESHRLSDAGRSLYRREVAATDFAHRRGLRVRPLGQRAHDDVAVRQDAEEPIVFQHDYVADVLPPHDLGSIHHRRTRGDDAGVRGHQE